MKKLIFKFLMCLCFSLFMIETQAANNDCKNIAKENLPEDVKSFITKYFPNENIKKIEGSKSCRHFEIKFDSGLELEIMSDGNWIEVERERNKGFEIKDLSFVPSVVNNTIKEKYNDKKIKKVEKEKWGYEIEFDDFTDKKAYFDKAGKEITREEKDQLKRKDRKK